MTRIYNHSGIVIFVGVDLGRETRFHELSPHCETPEGVSIVFLTTATSSHTVMGREGWDVAGAPSVHVVDDIGFGGRDLPIRLSAIGISPREDEIDARREPRGAAFAEGSSDVPRVTVLGAGIAGLTAAHELVERGFRVQVIEKNHGMARGSRFARGLDQPDVGGVVRTQWCTAPLHPEALPARLRSIHGDNDWRGARREQWAGSPVLPIAFDAEGVPQLEGEIEQWLAASTRPIAALQLVVVIYRSRGASRAAGPDAAYARLRRVSSWLEAHAEELRLISHIDFMPVARLEVDAEGPLPEEYVGLLVRIHDQPGRIAGDHGYHFFGGCYRHLRDTMRRTPIYDPAEQRFTGRTVHDSLKPLRYQVVEDPTRERSGTFPRQPPSTISAVVKQYRDLRRDLGYRPADLLRFSLRLMRYMTSSTERRARYYEGLSWWDFLTLRNLRDRGAGRVQLGQRYSRLLQQALEASGAIDTRYADARTVGNFSVQLAMDGFKLHGDRDATLGGPMSDAWFRHWREYLERQGVRFFVGEVTKLDARVTIAFPNGPPKGYFEADAAPRSRHYYVCAMDPFSTARVTGTSDGVAADIAAFVPADAEDLEIDRSCEQQDKKRTRFQTLTGIQLYYSTQVAPDASHVYYVESSWSLTAIAESRASPPIWSSLNVHIGSWNGQKLSPDDIAREVLRQTGENRPASPRPVYFHIDDSIQFAGEPLRATRNRAPYLVNLVDDWKNRPRGEPGEYDVTSRWEYRICGRPHAHVHSARLDGGGERIRPSRRKRDSRRPRVDGHLRRALLRYLESRRARARGPRIPAPDRQAPRRVFAGRLRRRARCPWPTGGSSPRLRHARARPLGRHRRRRRGQRAHIRVSRAGRESAPKGRSEGPVVCSRDRRYAQEGGRRSASSPRSGLWVRSTNVKGRVFNHSSASILVLVARPTERWLRLLAGAETAEHDDALMLRAEEPDATIMGERGWRLNGAVAHVIDDRRGLRVVGTGCTPADVIPDLPVEKDHPLLPQRPWVTVLGAGIAGLTAAHELIDRGFRVQVVEKNHGSPTDEDDERGYSRGLGSPDVGGIARTQWSTAPLGNGSAGPQRAKSIHGDGDWYGPDPEKWNDWKAQSTFAVPFTVRNEIEEAGLEAKPTLG